MIKLDYKSGAAIHEQITQGIKELVIKGAIKGGDPLPSVRELSVSLTVNPNTVQRAYKTLESDGIIYSIRGKGNFVAERVQADEKLIKSCYDIISEKVTELMFWGEDKEKIKQIIDNIYEQRREKK